MKTWSWFQVNALSLVRPIVWNKGLNGRTCIDDSEWRRPGDAEQCAALAGLNDVGPQILFTPINEFKDWMIKDGKFWQWLWLSLQSSCFRYQRFAVWMQSSARFSTEHGLLLTVEKDEYKEKRHREWPLVKTWKTFRFILIARHCMHLRSKLVRFSTTIKDQFARGSFPTQRTRVQILLPESVIENLSSVEKTKIKWQSLAHYKK